MEKQEKIIEKPGFGFTFNPNKCEVCGGKCCYGEKGYVFVSLEEIEAIADFLGITIEELGLKYLRKVGKHFSLIEKHAGDGKIKFGCIFLDEVTRKCKIYPVRPKQCKNFPFWSAYDEINDAAKIRMEELILRCIGVMPK